VTVTYTPAQIGTENVGAGTWVTGVFGIGPLATNVGGIQYTIPAPNQLMFRSLILTLTPPIGGTTGTLAIALCNDLNEAVFSNTNLPTNQATLPLYSAAHTFQAGVAVPITLNLGATELQTGAFVGGVESANQVLNHSGFGGNLALVLTFTGVFTQFATSAALVGDEVPFLSGLPSSKPMVSRADCCPRCGTPMFREQLVEDGYTRTLVCSRCWDPAEQRRRRYVPPKEVNP